MLKSLFGELTATTFKSGSAVPSFAATAMLESTDTRLSDDGRMVDRHQQDLFVTGSPAQAMRAHLARTQSATDVHTITLLDPSHLWAPGVVKALSDATGQPVERLHLREQATLRILATLERTVVPRRGETTLKIYHADLRAAEGESLRVPLVLMERSQMAAVIVGPMAAPDIDAMLQALLASSREPNWSCPALLFLLPPSGDWIAHKVDALDWPHALRIEVLSEPLIGTSSVWNALLAAWDRLHGPAAPPSVPAALEARGIARHLRTLMQADGVLGCALVDAADGELLAGESRDASIDLARAAAARTPVLRSHLQASAAMGLQGSVSEVTVLNGSICHVLRPLQRRPGQFLFARIDRSHANLALLKFKLAEVERNLA